MNLNEQNRIDYDLSAKYFAGEATAEETAAVLAWAASSPDNQALFAELKFIWADTKAVKNIGKEVLPDVDIEAALDKVKSRKAKQEVEPKLKVIKSPNRNFFLQIAAGLLLLVGAGWFAFNYLNIQSPPVELIADNEIIEQKLSDGTSIKLNKGATLTYPEIFADNAREVELRGEAFFEVEHDPTKPFVIHAGEADIRVLGTSFNIKSDSNVDSTLVYVESGKVLLYFEESKVMLTKGMTGVFYKTTRKVTVLETTVSDHSFWRNQNLYFKRTQLRKVVSKLNALYNVNIRLQNEKTADCNLTVDFENKTIDEILDIISLTLNLEVIRTAEGFVLEGDGC